MEMIIAILFFSLCSAVCIQLFARSHTLNRESTDLIQASSLSHNIAEVYMNGTLPQHYHYDRHGNLYYNKKWQADAQHKYYKVHLKITRNELKIGVFNAAEDNIYSLNVKNYHQKEVH